MAWRLQITEEAREQLERVDGQTRTRLLSFLHERVVPLADPRMLGKALQGGRGNWGYRVGDWRIIANFDHGELIIAVVRIGNRSDVYKHMRQGRR